MYIGPDEGSCYNFNTHICHSMSGYSCNMTDTQFIFESIAVTTMEEVCDNPENTEFDGLYLSFYETHATDEPFNYTITMTDGNVTLTVTNKLGNTATYANQPLSTQEISHRPTAIYPNPVSDKLMVSGTDLSDNLRIKIFNLQGQLILNMEGNNGKREFDLSKLSAGAYFVVVSNPSGERLLSEKIIKK